MATNSAFTISSTGKASIIHDGQALLDYKFDWSQWLDQTLDSLEDATATVTPGDPSDPANDIEVDRVVFSAGTGIVTVWVKGGVEGETAQLTCHIVTTAGREDERSIYLKVKNR